MAEPLTTASDNTAVINRINLLSQGVNQAGEDIAFRRSLNTVPSSTAWPPPLSSAK